MLGIRDWRLGPEKGRWKTGNRELRTGKWNNRGPIRELAQATSARQRRVIRPARMNWPSTTNSPSGPFGSRRRSYSQEMKQTYSTTGKRNSASEAEPEQPLERAEQQRQRPGQRHHHFLRAALADHLEDGLHAHDPVALHVTHPQQRRAHEDEQEREQADHGAAQRRRMQHQHRQHRGHQRPAPAPRRSHATPAGP